MRWLPLVAVASLVLACADDPLDVGSSGGTGTETGDGDGDVTGDGDGDATGDGDGEATGDGDGEATGDGDGEATGDGDGDPASGDGDGDVDPFPPCEADNFCADAENLGIVHGETSDEPIMITGNKDGWYWFNVDEDWNEPIEGEALDVLIQLAGPDGVDYDLEVYRSPEEGGVPCGNNEKIASNPGSNEVIYDTWGEGAFSNSSDDTRTLAVHVVSKTETCDPDAYWTLTIAGHTQDEGLDASEGTNGGDEGDCTSQQDCNSSMSIGTFPGDTWGPSVIAYGDTDAWVRWRAEEIVGGVGAAEMRVDVRLIGSPNSNYDIFVYRGNDDDDSPCEKNDQVGNEPTSTEFVQVDWGEQNSANFSDDSRTMAVHVVNADQVCDPNATWMLAVTGNL